MGDTLVHYLFVPRIIMQWLFPVVLTFALYLLMRGHDLPGGGFTAGIAPSIAFLLLYMANGTRLVEAGLSVKPVRWMAVGPVCAVATGPAAWLVGYPFLTRNSRYLQPPLTCEDR